MSRCDCTTCYEVRRALIPEGHILKCWSIGFRYACEICGNKRCPHHTEHNLSCTNSNEPGQEGSVYQ